MNENWREAWREIIRAIIACHEMQKTRHEYKVAKWQNNLLETYDK